LWTRRIAYQNAPLTNYSRDLQPAEDPSVILGGNNPQDRMSALELNLEMSALCQKQTSELIVTFKGKIPGNVASYLSALRGIDRRY
jgi:hypothetical protein